MSLKFKKTRLFLIAAVIILSFALSVFKNKIFADDAGEPYSIKSKDTIGTWYDETWEASSFYRTRNIAGANSMQYAVSYKPGTTVNPTYSIPPTQKDGNIIPGATLSSDMVVTEWKVTGHVHFKSRL